MNYTVQVGPSAARELVERTYDSVAMACVRFVYGALAADPRGVGTALRGPYEGLWMATRGEYRVHYRIDDETATIDVLDMTHRNQVAIRAILG